MKYKVYVLNKPCSRWATQFEVGDTTEFVTFSTIGFGTNYHAGLPRYATDREDIQRAIEASSFFANGKITLLKEEQMEVRNDALGVGVDAFNPVEGVTDYPDVTTFRTAQAILAGEPYNVPKTSDEIRTKEALLAKAAELGVTFSALK